ncbi:MAG: ribosomal L7Ae/L30e/S12e/Gadd45 family protein [Candidatus Aenigmarchaeota archaeon]|nr:ribosomal L7Ae/L30e/S12e/Gadd45 family protein [Candidatus Aenigmarchaeota archaeon]
MDLEKRIKTAVKENKALFGYREVLKKLKMSKELEMIILAKNTPENIKRDLELNAKLAGVEVQIFEGNGVELGNLCGKPFAVTVIGIKKG